MTRKDYILIAAAIHRSGMAHGIGRKSAAEQAGGNRALALLATDLAATLANENPNFDKVRFLAACGVSA